MQVRTFSSKGSEFDLPGAWDVGFHGAVLDSRGKAAVDALRDRCTTSRQCVYDREHLRALKVDGTRIHAREMAGLFTDGSARHVFEGSTLELVELLHLLRAAKKANVARVDIVYAEPESYRREVLSLESAWARGFSLSDNRQFEGVPGFSVDLNLQAAESSRLVAFLGYEGARFSQALQRLETLVDCPKSVVFGVPGYAAGWEMNALANNVAALSEIKASSVRYCPAASVSGALKILQQIHERDGEGSQMVIAPLGTKPHSIAATLFLVAHSAFQEATLIWDHPEPAQDRSSRVRRWHLYRLAL